MRSRAPRATRCAGEMPSVCSICRAPGSIAQLASGKLNKEVLEIGRTVQVANVILLGEIRQQRHRISRVAERGFAGELETLDELPSARVGPGSRFVAVHLDHLRLDVRGDPRSPGIGG